MCNESSDTEMAHTQASDGPVTRRQVLGQVAICLGCCCGRLDRGFPAVPVERLKSVWKREKLNRTIQLTISGCLGPCDVANVVAVLDDQRSHWFGGLAGDAPYDALIEWARACQRTGRLSALPAALESLRFERFAAGCAATPCPETPVAGG